MNFTDITHSKKTRFTLKENERSVFFMRNRGGAFEFILAGKGAEAHVFALFEGTESDQFSLSITQNHTAPHTASTALVTSLLSGSSSLSYEGLIRITKAAHHTDAKQENRNLLLSEAASAISIPSLEILNNDVVCEHASATGTLSEEAILYMNTRGLDRAKAETLLADGVVRDFFHRLERYADTSGLTHPLSITLS